MALLDGPWENRPARYATDEEWQAAVDAANAVEDLPVFVWDE